MILGIDIDDTLTNSKEEIAKAWKDYYRLYDLGTYTDSLPSNINTAWNDKYISRFWDLYRTQIASSAKAKEYASEALYNLKSNGHIIKIITARPEDQRLVTLKSLKSQLLLFDELVLKARYKGKTCIEHGVELLIDDTKDNLEDASLYGINTLLFKETDNWKDVYKKIIDINKKRRF